MDKRKQQIEKNKAKEDIREIKFKLDNIDKLLNILGMDILDKRFLDINVNYSQIQTIRLEIQSVLQGLESLQNNLE